MSDDADKQARRLAWNRGFVEAVPHNRALGIQIVDLGPDWALFLMPYDPRFVGNPETGVLHGGVITALLDACCGAAVFNSLVTPAPIATLDLRIDYLKPAASGREVRARATCYRSTRNVAFARAVAYHDDEADPIASAAGTFMLSTKIGASARASAKGGGS
jgi:uncharacterized protein (TIGR00369 family)